MTTAYYPGCSEHGLSQEYGQSARFVCAHMKLEMQEIKDWNCCGATAAHSLNNDLDLALNIRNLAQAKKQGHDAVVTPCPGCFSRLKTATRAIVDKSGKAQEIAAKLNCSVPDKVEAKHLLQIIMETFAPDRIKTMVKKPLQNLSLAAYYGCLITRPAALTRFDDPEQPMSMDILMRALGAETVIWPHKTECCGGGFIGMEPDICADLSTQILNSAKQAGARAIVVACPLCQINLDSRQEKMPRAVTGERLLPVIYFTQLMGFAFGYSWKEMQFGKLFASPKELFTELHLL